MGTQQLIIRFLPLEVLLIGAITVAVVLNQTGIELRLPVWSLESQAAAVVAEAPGAASASAGALTISPVFTPEVQYWADEIAGWAGQYGVDPNLVATVMQIESCGLPSAVSSSGAQGLFQVMPFHFENGENMQDPNINAARGIAYLALGLTRASGDVGLALAGYNGGHGQISKNPALWPEQTKRYWYWGTGIYADAVSGNQSSARLQEWLSAGGASLCARAANELGLR